MCNECGGNSYPLYSRVEGERNIMADTLPTEFGKLRIRLVLSTSYPLGWPETYKIVVGLHSKRSGSFEPVVKIVNSQSTEGIVLQRAEWLKLEAHLPLIQSHTAGRLGDVIPTPLPLGEHHIRFCNTAEGPAIIFEQCLTEPMLQSSAGPMVTLESSPSVFINVRKGLDPSFTLTGLHVHRLERYKGDVLKCCTNIINALHRYNVADYVYDVSSGGSVESFIEDYIAELKMHMKSCDLDSKFVDLFFDTAFTELTTYCVPFITSELTKKHDAYWREIDNSADSS